MKQSGRGTYSIDVVGAKTPTVRLSYKKIEIIFLIIRTNINNKLQHILATTSFIHTHSQLIMSDNNNNNKDKEFKLEFGVSLETLGFDSAVYDLWVSVDILLCKITDGKYEEVSYKKLINKLSKNLNKALLNLKDLKKLKSDKKIDDYL